MYIILNWHSEIPKHLCLCTMIEPEVMYTTTAEQEVWEKIAKHLLVKTIWLLNYKRTLMQ